MVRQGEEKVVLKFELVLIDRLHYRVKNSPKIEKFIKNYRVSRFLVKIFRKFFQKSPIRGIFM
jgi:ribosomal protein L15E